MAPGYVFYHYQVCVCKHAWRWKVHFWVWGKCSTFLSYGELWLQSQAGQSLLSCTWWINTTCGRILHTTVNKLYFKKKKSLDLCLCIWLTELFSICFVCRLNSHLNALLKEIMRSAVAPFIPPVSLVMRCWMIFDEMISSLSSLFLLMSC